MGGGMKQLVMIVIGLLMPGVLAFGNGAETITVQQMRGDVLVRHGVAEDWMAVKPGEKLKPDDTMKTGPNGTATIAAIGEGSAVKTLVLPSEVIVDLSDVRNLTPEELMLKLTMEKVRASSYHWKNSELHFSNSTIVHGTDMAADGSGPAADLRVGHLELNGSKVLFDNGFFSTCALRTMDILRRYPLLGEQVDARLMMAEALDKAHLRGEAISEYNAILQMESLGADQRALVKKRIDLLRDAGGN
jgi:hypothetical protein